MKAKNMWNLCHVYFEPMQKDLTRERSNMRFLQKLKQLWKKPESSQKINAWTGFDSVIFNRRL